MFLQQIFNPKNKHPLGIKSGQTGYPRVSEIILAVKSFQWCNNGEDVVKQLAGDGEECPNPDIQEMMQNRTVQESFGGYLEVAVIQDVSKGPQWVDHSL